MVSFTCSDCNQVLKKNKVDAHFVGRCRNAAYVSCVDCSVDFYGEDYAGHVNCISEAAKYGGKNYIENPGANKGQKKQQQWVDKVQEAVDTAISQSHDPKLTEMLEYIKTASNLPQKKPKLVNYLKSTFPRYRQSDSLFEAIWTLLEKVKADLKASESSTENTPPIDSESAPITDKAKKKKKRGAPGADGEAELQEQEVEAIREKKRQKREAKPNPQEENVERLNNTLEVEEKKSSDFQWEAVILGILGKGEITLKKLRKKVVAEYVSCGRFMKAEERVWKKLDKKLNSLPTVQVNNDRVSLVDE